MLEVLGMQLTEANVKIMNEGIPEELKVNLNIDRVTKHDDSNVVLEFSYQVEYAPALAAVFVRGIAFCRDTPQNIKKTLEAWRSKKGIPPELGGAALNMINANVAVNTIFLIRPFNLVPHFMPPPVYEGAPVPKSTGKPKPKKKKKR